MKDHSVKEDGREVHCGGYVSYIIEVIFYHMQASFQYCYTACYYFFTNGSLGQKIIDRIYNVKKKRKCVNEDDPNP